MNARLIKNNVYFVGSIDWDRRLFDELIPLPDGTSYNSYIIKGSEKNALIDTVDPVKENELVSNIRSLGITKLDYVITNHAEQDHSGGLPRVLAEFPEAKVVTNAKCRDFIMSLLHIPEGRIIVVKDKDTLSLGDKTLEFMIAPWVHWPETMFTYLKEDKIIFTCDFLGSHYATSDLFAVNEEIYKPSKRYYAEIMMPFRPSVKTHIETVKKMDIDMVCASHGPVHNKPEFIISCYEDWSGDIVKNEVLIPYVSAHGSTKIMVDHLMEKLVEKGIRVQPFSLNVTDVGELAMALVDAATIVVATPTILAGPHPVVSYAVNLANALRPKTKFVSIMNTYSWGGKTIDILASSISNLKVEVITPVTIKGLPEGDDFKLIDQLAENIYAKHKETGIV